MCPAPASPGSFDARVPANRLADRSQTQSYATHSMLTARMTNVEPFAAAKLFETESGTLDPRPMSYVVI